MLMVGNGEPAFGNSGSTITVGVGVKTSRVDLVGVGVDTILQLQSFSVTHDGLTQRELVPSVKRQTLPFPHSLLLLQRPQQALLQTQSLSSGHEGTTHFLLPATS
jgi:hypothetical protein